MPKNLPLEPGSHLQNQDIPFYLRNLKLHGSTQNISPLDPFLSQKNPTNILNTIS